MLPPFPTPVWKHMIWSYSKIFIIVLLISWCKHMSLTSFKTYPQLDSTEALKRIFYIWCIFRVTSMTLFWILELQRKPPNNSWMYEYNKFKLPNHLKQFIVFLTCLAAELQLRPNHCLRSTLPNLQSPANSPGYIETTLVISPPGTLGQFLASQDALEVMFVSDWL